MALHEVRLLRREAVAEGTMAFWFSRPAGFGFRAGQSLLLGLIAPPETDGEGDSRTFTIASAPGETTSSTDTVQSGDKLDPEELFVPANAKSISVLAETSTSVPFAVAVVDVLGNVVHSARSSDGVASLDVPVSGFGLYSIQVINLGLGPVTVWSAATPYLSTG